MLRGIRIVAIFAFAIIVGYAAGELGSAQDRGSKAEFIILLLVSVLSLVGLGLLELHHLRRPNKKKHRFGTHHTGATAARAGGTGYSSIYSARPNDEAWRVRKQHSSGHQRRSKPRK